MAKDVDVFSTPKLIVVLHLQYKGIEPIRRTVEDGKAILHYHRTPELEAILSTHMTRCSECGVSFDEIADAYAKAKRALLDGELGEKRDERGGAR